MRKLLIFFSLFLTLSLSGQIFPGVISSQGGLSPFPHILGSAQGRRTSAGTSQTITMPANTQVGDLIVAFVAIDGNGAATINTVSSGLNWTIEKQAVGDSVAGTACRGLVIWKVAEGADALVLASANEESSHITYRIDNFLVADPMTVTSATGNQTTDANPPSNTGAYGADDYLWIVFDATDDYYPATVAPSDFSNLLTQEGDGTGSATVSIASRNYNTAAAYDPGIFTRATKTDWASFTIIINPL